MKWAGVVKGASTAFGVVEDGLTGYDWAGAGNSAFEEGGDVAFGAEAGGCRDFEMSLRAEIVEDGLNVTTEAKTAVDLVSADRQR